MKYRIKEIFLTVQGEGFHAGTLAVFLRFSGCNFWNGDPEKKRYSFCPFCDTDFVGEDGQNGGVFEGPLELAARVKELAGNAAIVVCTGGEPLIQLDEPLIAALREEGFRIHVETNGSLRLLERSVDWVCCSPKSRDALRIERCDELKVILPAQRGNVLFYGVRFDTPVRFVQPEDGDSQQASFEECVRFVHENPSWRISVQTHKILGIP